MELDEGGKALTIIESCPESACPPLVPIIFKVRSTSEKATGQQWKELYVLRVVRLWWRWWRWHILQ